MKKIAIPAILVATIMVAGMFAFMPVEQASTVHLSSTTLLAPASVTLIANTQQTFRIVTNTIAEIAVGANTDSVTCNQPFQVLNVTWDTTDVSGNDTYAATAPVIDIDGAGGLDASPVLAGGTFVATIAAAGGSTEAISTFLGTVGAGTDGTVSVTYTGVTAEVDAATISWLVSTTSAATCT